jgi:simple sugar transport system permease protein
MGISINLVRFITTTVGGFLPGVGAAFLSLSGNPLRCAAAALLFGGAGALGPSLQSVGVTQGYYFFNAAAYILTLGIMIATSSAKHSARDMPGELSMAR